MKKLSLVNVQCAAHHTGLRPVADAEASGIAKTHFKLAVFGTVFYAVIPPASSDTISIDTLNSGSHPFQLGSFLPAVEIDRRGRTGSTSTDACPVGRPAERLTGHKFDDGASWMLRCRRLRKRSLSCHVPGSAGSTLRVIPQHPFV